MVRTSGCSRRRERQRVHYCPRTRPGLSYALQSFGLAIGRRITMLVPMRYEELPWAVDPPSGLSGRIVARPKYGGETRVNGCDNVSHPKSLKSLGKTA
jgi:hypothetical protein